MNLDGLIGGYKVYVSPMIVKTYTKRVRGGFADRWLIRELVHEPAMMIDDRTYAIYCHPELAYKLDQILKHGIGIKVNREQHFGMTLGACA